MKCLQEQKRSGVASTDFPSTAWSSLAKQRKRKQKHTVLTPLTAVPYSWCISDIIQTTDLLFFLSNLQVPNIHLPETCSTVPPLSLHPLWRKKSISNRIVLTSLTSDIQVMSTEVTEVTAATVSNKNKRNAHMGIFLPKNWNTQTNCNLEV